MAIRIGANGGQPLIPDIAGLTAAVREKLSANEENRRLLGIVDEHFVKDEKENPNIEDMLSHIRSLVAAAGKDEARGLTIDELELLDNQICEIIHEAMEKELPNDDTPYHHVASWIDATGRDFPVEIFTTNYDLLMEQAFEGVRVPFFDGFAGAQKPFFDLRSTEDDYLPPRWARLWKLHGSINWYQIPEKGVIRTSIPDLEDVRRVIHPSHLKYQESRRLPYLAMLDRLRAFLKRPNATLILCGYSFRDEHINEVIVNGLQATQSAVGFVLLYEPLAQYPEVKALARSRQNLIVMAKDGGIIGGKESTWPERNAATDTIARNDWINWVPVNPQTPEGKQKAEFVLGDFAVFGRFLRELTGGGNRLIEGENG